MNQLPKIRSLARLLIGKYGQRAPVEAEERAASRLKRKNYNGAAIWAAIADVARQMTSTGFRVVRQRPEPSLSKVLDGEVTQAVMKADHVARKDVEAVLHDARDKRGPK